MAKAILAPRRHRSLRVQGERTMAAGVFGGLHEAIVNGRFGPGERLRIEELAAAFRISPTPVREALQRLEATGLVERIPHCGAKVADVSLSDLKDVFEARLNLEPIATSKAAARFTREVENTARRQLDALAAALRREDQVAVWKIHTKFHFTFYSASGSPWLLRLITPIWESSQRYRFKFCEKESEERTLEHARILQACAAHDSELAAKEMYDHIANVANIISLKMGGLPLFKLRNGRSARAARG